MKLYIDNSLSRPLSKQGHSIRLILVQPDVLVLTRNYRSFLVFYCLLTGEIATSNIIIYFCPAMNIKTDTSQIILLKQAVERTIDFPLSTHGDFLRLSAGIEITLREHMSESTLERLWGYSTRHYDTVSVRTLNVLARFVGYHSWVDFCTTSEKTVAESELFIDKAICAADLNIGDKLRIGWPPDRICTIRYLGDNNFIAEETANSTMQSGDTFSCIQIQKGRPLHLDNFRKVGSTEKLRYVVGINTGLTILEVIKHHSMIV